MGIEVEFNPDLTLRKFGTPNKLEKECIPENLKEREIYYFLKKGQRNYWLKGDIPLLITDGNQQLSDPVASIQILEATHFIKDGEVYTKGKYKVMEVFNDNNIHFNNYKRVE